MGTVIGALTYPILGPIVITPILIVVMSLTSIITFFGTREDPTVVPASVNFRESVRAVLANHAFRPYIATIMAWMAVSGMLWRVRYGRF